MLYKAFSNITYFIKFVQLNKFRTLICRYISSTKVVSNKVEGFKEFNYEINLLKLKFYAICTKKYLS